MKQKRIKIQGHTMTDYEHRLTSANLLIEAAFCIDSPTKLDQARARFPDLKECGGDWGARLQGGLPADRHTVGLKANGDGQILTWAAHLLCGDPATLPSTQSSIASQLNVRLGKARERQESETTRCRIWVVSPVEIVKLYRRQTEREGVLLTEFVLARLFKQPEGQQFQMPTIAS